MIDINIPFVKGLFELRLYRTIDAVKYTQMICFECGIIHGHDINAAHHILAVELTMANLLEIG